MKKTKKRALYILAALLAALFVLSCLVGFAACGGGSTEDDGATVSTVSVTADKSSIAVGETATLTASVTMSDGGAYDGSYTWSSSATSVASVEGSGATATVTAKAEGEATITVAVADSKSATYKVTVTDESGSQGGGEGGSGVYDNTLSIEAEDAALFNSMESSASSTTLIGTEETTLSDKTTVITNVKNFNTAGDKIVFQVLASAAISDVKIEITACNGATFGGTFADNDKILTVNGGEPVSLTGTLTNSAFNWTSYGALSGTISLQKGINYIEITAASTSVSGYLNVDRIDLSWDGEATIEEVNDYTGEVFEVDETGVATLEAEDAALINAVGVSGSTYLLGTETDSNDESVTQVNNFNAKGDKIVFQLLAAAAIDNVSLDLYARLGGTHSAAYDSDNFISVNGTAVSHTGSVASSTYGDPVTATISLNAGINYIVIEMEESGTEFLGMNMGLMNVDRIDLNGGTGAEAEPEAAEVSSADELVEALEAGGEIVLADDIKIADTSSTEPSTLVVSEDTELDLAGYTLSCGTDWTPVPEDTELGIRNDVMISVATGATLTVEDTSSDGSGKIDYDFEDSTGITSTSAAWPNSANNGAAIEMDGGSLVVESGTVESNAVAIRAKSGEVEINGGLVHSSGYYVIWMSNETVTVTINDGVVAGATHGILVDGDSNFGQGTASHQLDAVTTLNVTGGTVYSGGTSAGAIRTESMSSRKSTIINISGGNVISAASAPAVTLLNGTLTITGGYIEGPTAVEIQAGAATISGGTFVATGEQSIKFSTSSTSFTSGYALIVYARGYVSVNDKKATDDDFDTKVDVAVTGGTYVGDILVSKTNAYAWDKSKTRGTTAEYADRASLTEDKLAQGSYDYIWTLGDDNYKVSITVDGITLTDSTVSYTGSNVNGTGNTACLVYTYEDLTDNFVTGAYVESGSIPEEAYKVSGVAFTGSEVTSVERVGTTYIVNCKTAEMSTDQLNAFWGGNTEAATGHENDQYIMVLITADESDSFTIVTDKNPEGYEMGGTSGNDGFSMCFAVSDAETAEGAYLFTIVVDGVEFDVVLGTVTLATAAQTP